MSLVLGGCHPLLKKRIRLPRARLERLPVAALFQPELELESVFVPKHRLRGGIRQQPRRLLFQRPRAREWVSSAALHTMRD